MIRLYQADDQTYWGNIIVPHKIWRVEDMVGDITTPLYETSSYRLAVERAMLEWRMLA